MEQALYRFAEYVDSVEGAGEGAKYAELAKFLLDSRGHGNHRDGEYDQSHLPVTQPYAGVGHAVRAVYSYGAMADAAKATGDVDNQSAVRVVDAGPARRRRRNQGPLLRRLAVARHPELRAEQPWRSVDRLGEGEVVSRR
jgi:hypothetical protein